jgi:hypothetical protein
MLEGPLGFPCMGVPNTSDIISFCSRVFLCNTYAVKSAEAVAAILASGESRACQTAPL